MADWRANFTPAELERFRHQYGADYESDVTPCHCCGTPTPFNLLDAKPGTPAAVDETNPNFERLECKPCYGEGWIET